MASLNEALSHLSRHTGDSECGWLTVDDLRAAITTLYHALHEDIGNIGQQPDEHCCNVVATEITPGVGPTTPGTAIGDMFVNTVDQMSWVWDGSQWTRLAVKPGSTTHFGTAGDGPPPPGSAHGAGDKYLDLSVPDGSPSIYMAELNGRDWQPSPSFPLNTGDQFYDIANYDIWLGG